jgi:hypothetical protein
LGPKPNEHPVAVVISASRLLLDGEIYTSAEATKKFLQPTKTRGA